MEEIIVEFTKVQKFQHKYILAILPNYEIIIFTKSQKDGKELRFLYDIANYLTGLNFQ